MVLFLDGGDLCETLCEPDSKACKLCPLILIAFSYRYLRLNSYFDLERESIGSCLFVSL